ncbi:MAG: hypothetical protein KA160_00670 [Lacibacter sp.]|nr:hypothetical protein [Lacibacter sp.]
MGKIDDKIFKQLNELNVTPPPELWEELRLRLFENDSAEQFRRLKDYDLAPPDGIFKDILDKNEDGKVASITSRLQHHEIEPPAGLFNKSIVTNKQNEKTEHGWLYKIGSYKRLVAAAIVAAITMTVVFVVKDNNTPANHSVAGANEIEKKNEKDTTSNIVVNDRIKKSSAPSSYKKARKLPGLVKPQYLGFYSMQIDGLAIPVYDNDVLFSLAQYQPRKKRINFQENDHVEITIGSGSNIAISKYMVSVINDLYGVKRNGKSTLKAKRTKAKILRWRKEDARIFSKKRKNNPLDLIDLADNVYK